MRFLFLAKILENWIVNCQAFVILSCQISLINRTIGKKVRQLRLWEDTIIERFYWVKNPLNLHLAKKKVMSTDTAKRVNKLFNKLRARIYNNQLKLFCKMQDVVLVPINSFLNTCIPFFYLLILRYNERGYVKSLLRSNKILQINDW